MWRHEIVHESGSLKYNAADQLSYRLTSITPYLESISQLDAITSRGGPLAPTPAGVYKINQDILESYRNQTYANHASNLGALIAESLMKQWDIPGFIVDPVTTDDMIDVARISGVPGVVRKSRSHALNIRYCAKKAAKELGISINDTRFIAAHLGSGFSIAAVSGGKIMDVNDALLGMGPFSVERAGALPIAGLLDIMEKLNYSRKEIERLLSKESGIKGYLGTQNIHEVEKEIQAGDEHALLIFRAMIYQTAKEIGSVFAALKGKVNGLILTGGVAFSQMAVEKLTEYIPFIPRRFVYPGSFELEAMSEAVLRVISNEESVKEYKPC